MCFFVCKERKNNFLPDNVFVVGICTSGDIKKSSTYTIDKPKGRSAMPESRKKKVLRK